MDALVDCSGVSDLVRAFLRAFPPFPLRDRSAARRSGEALSAGGIPGDIASLSACLAVILRRGRCGRGVRHAILVLGGRTVSARSDTRLRSRPSSNRPRA